MANECDRSLVKEVLQPFRRFINTEPPREKILTTKLHFSDSNQPIKEGTPQHARLVDSTIPEKRVRTDSSSSTVASPWEAKRMKIDLIAAKAQITKLEARVNKQHTIRKEMQLLFEEENSSLVDQHKRDERAVADMEERLQLLRKREQELRDEYNEAVKEHRDSKIKWEKDRNELQKEIAELKDKLLESNVSSKDRLSVMKKDMDELLQSLEGAQQEVEMLRKEVVKQTARAEQCITLQSQLGKLTFELQSVTNKLKEIEYEKDSYKDWQQQAKTAQKRLSNMAELEKEVIRLRSTERSLREMVRNKLALEEQVHLQTTKVEALQPVQQELNEAKVKLASLESSLEDWKKAAQSHGINSARSLASTLDSALNGHAVAGCSQTKFAQLTEEVANLKFELNKATAKLNDVQIVRKNHESLIHRLQKRLLLVTRERDSYRQQLDSYEKELTVSLSGTTGAGCAAILTARVAELEKALQEYRDLLANQDHESQAKALDSARAETSKYRKEAEAAKHEVLKLLAQRDQLQAQLEKLSSL